MCIRYIKREWWRYDDNEVGDWLKMMINAVDGVDDLIMNDDVDWGW